MKKIFISHSSADERIVSLFVDKVLHAGCGVSMEDIFYTSREDTGIVNGDDIPDSIKTGIKESAIFFMMVSENYRKSEVCLNEMGAAWATEGLKRKIMILPGAGFDRIGWLMSLKKGTKLDDSDGLDMIHDEILNVTGSKIKTVTWNRYKAEFLSMLRQISRKDAIIPESEDVVFAEEDGEELDILDLRERMDSNMKNFNSLLNSLAGETQEYASDIKSISSRLIELNSNPNGFSSTQVRGVMQRGANCANSLSVSYEQNLPLLRSYFDDAIKYAIKLQKGRIDEVVKRDNRSHFTRLIDVMIKVKDQFSSFRKALDGMVNLDKTYTKANNRLKKAVDAMLEVVSFCIVRAGEFKMA